MDKLARGADVWLPVETALPQILELVVQRPDEAPFVAEALYAIAVAQEYKVPDALKFVLFADDDFSLAASGVFGFEDVYRRFIKDIKVAMGTKTSNQPPEPARLARGSS